MTDTQETGAEVIAEYRADADKMDAHELPQPTTQYLRIMLDRLETAWKRDTKELRVEIERLKEERNYSGVRERERLRANGFAIVPKEQLERGDCAKLREACASIAEYARSAICHATDAHLLGYLNQIEGWSKAALSAPPRNCDRPECATTKAAQDVWRKEDGGKTAYYEWLLATHEKGNNDADK